MIGSTDFARLNLSIWTGENFPPATRRSWHGFLWQTFLNFKRFKRVQIFYAFWLKTHKYKILWILVAIPTCIISFLVLFQYFFNTSISLFLPPVDVLLPFNHWPFRSCFSTLTLFRTNACKGPPWEVAPIASRESWLEM